MPNIPQEFPFRMVAGTSLEARLDARCWGLYVSNYTAQWVEIADANEFVPPNTRQVISLPGVLVAKATFAAPPGVIQPVAVAAQAAILTYTEREVQPSGGVVGATALPAVTQVERFTKALLPAAGSPGRLVLLTTFDKSVWKDTGTQFVSLEGERFNVKQFGAVGDGVADDTVAIDAAITAASNTSTPGDVFFPTGRYKRTTPITAVTGVRLIGSGASNRWGRNPTISQYPTRIEYAGATAALNIVAPAAGSIRNFKVQNIHFDGANSAGAVDGVVFDATNGAASIVGVVIEDCAFTNFPRSQVRQLAMIAGQAVWGVTFSRCLFHDLDRAATGDLVAFLGPSVNVTTVRFDDCIAVVNTAGFWCYNILSTSTVLLGGVVTPNGAVVSHGAWLRGYSTVIGTHFEGGSAVGTFGARLGGVGGHVFHPAIVTTWGTGLEIGDPANGAEAAQALVAGQFTGNVTRDLHIVSGGSRVGTVIGPLGVAAMVILDDRAGIDGAYEVILFDGSRIKVPIGTAASPSPGNYVYPTTGPFIDAATGDLAWSIAGTVRMRMPAATVALSVTSQLYPGSGVTANAAQLVTGLLAGNGVPTNAVGNNGDFYFRGDGAAGTFIYHRAAGVWTAFA